MKIKLSSIIIGILIFIASSQIKAQQTGVREDKLYTMSSIGFSFPIGETADYLKPKFSSSLGLNLGLGNSGLFIYPKVSLHSYSYNELSPEPGFNYALQKGRATTYLLNMALGYRKISGKFATYGFAGGGGGFILTPNVTVNPITLQAVLDNKTNNMGIVEAGAGTEYNLGGAVLFVEISYMHGFSDIQNRGYSVVPVTLGIKPNLSKWFNKKK